jgi:hypothetical protein
MYTNHGVYNSLPSFLGSKAAAAKFGQEASVKRRPSLSALVGCLFVPWLIFTTTFWLRSFELRRDSEAFSNALCYCILFPVLAFAYMTCNLIQSGDAKPMAFLTLTSLLAWVLAFSQGDSNYQSFMRPYYDIGNLNTYPSVDPSKFMGTQLMDAGMVQFTKGSAIQLEKSVGFKNDDMYCVAPIGGSSNSQTTFDFWAVGLNCCSGHLPDFKCGEYSNPSASWGLRLMDDSKRDMFRLAVKQAEAAFNLKAPHPVFMYWLTDPMAEVNAYQDDGFRFFIMYVSGYGAVQLFLVICGIIVLAKL